jgi:O-antigen/teichoic acid export membrane protein
MLAESVGSVLIPRISGLQANDSHPEIVSLTVRAMRALAFVYAPVFTFLFLAANQVIGILYPARFLSSVPIFRVNLLMVPLAVVAVDPIVRAFKSERFWMLKMNIALLAIQCAGLVFSIQRFGLIGAIFCVVAIQYTARTLVAWRVSGILGVRRSDLRPLKDVALMFGAAAFAGLCIAGILGPAGTWAASLAASLGNEAARRFLSSGFSLALCGSIFSALYLAALFALKVPTESEVQWCWSSALRVARIRTK